MALAGVTLRTTKGSKLTIAELDSNFSAITSSVETSTANITTINSRVSQSVIAFPNLTTTANGLGGVGLITSGNLFVTGALSVSGSVTLNSVVTLGSSDPLPTGQVGQLAVSQSLLYFHNGATWKEVSLVP